MSFLLPFSRRSQYDPIADPIHFEKHFDSPEVVRDIILGLSDGLTVPFALAAGLSATMSSKTVLIAGLAELISGAISMGLGGYLATKSESDHYDTERIREECKELYTRRDTRDYCALTIGIAYFIGGLIPLIPYFFVDTPFVGLCISSSITLLCLVVFGFIKSLFIAPNRAYIASIQTAFVGALAAGSAYGGVTLIDRIFRE
ncbi:14187_t:CDS:2 [Entrophospora sp. SA101]|nr:2755_t:CDS:2 [Entrophospora sp. SA101]CAJ0749302.1 14187_t:CDS:2 [Entrophospora sp. SA101]CAJ0861637.1 17622_t:CDS:2 [Entrophospora sp. SA101]